MSLDGKVAIVTGGGQGLGRAIALVLSRRGVRVAVTGRTPATIEAVVAEIASGGGEAIAVAGDVGSRADVRRAVDATIDAYGGLDILINNAQSSKPGIMLADLGDEDFELVFRSGALGTLYAMQACYPHLKRRGGGSIVNLGSSTSITGDRGFAPYVMAKEAVRGLTRVAANEWGRDGIRVNVVCPAAMSPSSAAFRDADPDRWARIVRQIPLGRMGDDIADIGCAVAALVDDDLRFLTGATLLLDGGRLLVA
ncbi:MAG TPA: SDR family NAD(P)-dependent oxidoreductase [Acidimicrobiales bacterium]|nr:SDR family NAD(P)-dependent oxidoreductase [Acidimicrobiales bacterium]